MLCFHINLHIVLNDKKISAIRELRRVTGMNIADAKTFVETLIDGFSDSFGGPLICNAEQAARIAELHINNANNGWSVPTEPTFTITNMKEIVGRGIDISHIVL